VAATATARRGVGKPVCLLSGMFSCKAEGSPRRSRRSLKGEDGRGTPCCFRYVTVESTEWAVAPFKEPVTGAAMCVAFSPHIHPRLYSPAGRQFTRLHCAFGPYLCVQLPSTRPQDESLPSATLHATYHGAGLAPAFSAKLLLDGACTFGMLREASPASSRARQAHNKELERDFSLAAPRPN